MFGCGYRTQFINGRKEKFVRLDDDDDAGPAATSTTTVMDHHHDHDHGGHGGGGGGFHMDSYFSGNPSAAASKFRARSVRVAAGVMNRSERLKSIGLVFQEDFRKMSQKVFDPQDAFLARMNRAFVFACIVSVAIDPLFLYLLAVKYTDKNTCIGFDRSLATAATVVRTAVDAFYLARIALQFRTAYIAPSSRVFGRGELVIDSSAIAARYLRRFFAVDLLAVLPLPQVSIWNFLNRPKGADLLPTKNALLFTVLAQYVPRLVRFYPITSELKRTTGVFAETAFGGAAFYLLLYMLASHMVGAFWYLLAIERLDDCWRDKCTKLGFHQCRTYMYCGGGSQGQSGFLEWRTMIRQVLEQECAPVDRTGTGFPYGIYTTAIQTGVYSTENLTAKILFCLWWGLQNLSTIGQSLETTHYKGEQLFSITLALVGLILMALLIGNMQTYLQSMTLRLEEMRLKRRDSEQWMHHRVLPEELRDRVWRHNQYKWLETRGVDEDALVRGLPKDLRRDVKRHLCLRLVRRVPLFANMDERLLDAICERLKPSLWALDPKAGANFPLSTRTVRAISEVEAFALRAEELKFVAGQFRRLHSKQLKRKAAEQRRREEEEMAMEEADAAGASTSRIKTTVLVSRFAKNAMRGVQRQRSVRADTLIMLPKPPEPDFASMDY